MTMKITITNDSSNNQDYRARVTVRDIGAEGERFTGEIRVLKPGESCESWIHDRRDILVEETKESV